MVCSGLLKSILVPPFVTVDAIWFVQLNHTEAPSCGLMAKRDYHLVCLMGGTEKSDFIGQYERRAYFKLIRCVVHVMFFCWCFCAFLFFVDHKNWSTAFHLLSSWCLAVIFGQWRWRRYAPLKRRFVFNGPHGVISLKIIFLKTHRDGTFRIWLIISGTST